LERETADKQRREEAMKKRKEKVKIRNNKRDDFEEEYEEVGNPCFNLLIPFKIDDEIRKY